MKCGLPKNSQFLRRPVRCALLHEGAERRNTGAVANHDHRRLRVSRQTEVVVVLDKDADFAILFHAVGEEAGGAASQARPSMS